MKERMSTTTRFEKDAKVIRKWPITEKAVSYWEGGEARNLARDFDRFLGDFYHFASVSFSGDLYYFVLLW